MRTRAHTASQNLHVDVEAKVEPAGKEVVARVEVDQEQDADEENLQSENKDFKRRGTAMAGR